jgi:hypothetical protein
MVNGTSIAGCDPYIYSILGTCVSTAGIGEIPGMSLAGITPQMIVTILQMLGYFVTADWVLEWLTGNTGLTDIDDIIESMIKDIAGTGGTSPGVGSLVDKYKSGPAPGWEPKKLTKYVRGQAQFYDGWYKPVKNFTVAECNAYLQGYRQARVRYKKWASRKAKRAFWRGVRNAWKYNRGQQGQQIIQN